MMSQIGSDIARLFGDKGIGNYCAWGISWLWGFLNALTRVLPTPGPTRISCLSKQDFNVTVTCPKEMTDKKAALRKRLAASDG